MKAAPIILIAPMQADLARACEKALQHSGVAMTVHAVRDADAFAAAIAHTTPDVVLGAWEEARFAAGDALAALRARKLDTAVIAVARTAHREDAARMVAMGLSDLAVLDGRFAFTLRRTLADLAARRARARDDEAMAVRVALAEASEQLAPDGILVTDRRGRVVSFNARFREIWKISDDCAPCGSARRIFDAMCRELADTEGFLRRLRAVSQDPSTQGHDEFTLKDGQIFDSYTAPLETGGASGEGLGRVWFFRELTAVRDGAKADEEFLRVLTEQDIAGAFIFDLDGVIRYINPKFAQMLGYTVEEVTGRDFAEFIAPDMRAETVAIFRRVAGGAEASAQVSTRVIEKGAGAIDLVGQWIIARHQGAPVVMGIAIDITALKRTQKALEASEGLYQTVVSSMAEGVLVVDTDGRIVTCNQGASRILGRPQTEILGRECFDPAWGLVDEGGKALTDEERPSVIALHSGKPFYDRLVGVRRADGALLWLSINAQPLFEKGNATPSGAVVSFVDITPHKHDQDTLTAVNHALNVLNRANEVVVRAVEEQELFDQMCHALVDTGGYRLAWIGLRAEQPALAVRAVAGTGETGAQPLDHDWSELLGVNGRADAALRSGKPEIDQDLAGGGCAQRKGTALPTSGSRIVLPLMDRGEALGVLTLYADETDAFTQDEVDLLGHLAEDLTYGIVSLRERKAREASEKRLHRAMEDAVQAIASTLEMRDPYTAGHQRDVAKLAVAIARELHVAEKEIEGIYLAAIVHDIGKIRIPSDILSKPGPLTKLEYELIQTHAQIGYDIMKHVDFPWPVAQMILQHHERLDGSGYPAGLKGDRILQGAKIIAVADVVQAMSMRRPYRGAFGSPAALEEISRGRGRLYDPAAVDACFKLFHDKGFHFA